MDTRYMGGGTAINAAYKKYGKENFVKTIIADYPTRKETSDHERMAVTMIQLNDEMCYNLRTGGDNEHTPSEETRKRIGNINRGIKRTPEMNMARSEQFTGSNNPFYGKSHTDETKALLREINLGESNGFHGKSHTDETKSYLSDVRRRLNHGANTARLGVEVNEETRLKLSIANTGKKRTDEQKEAMRLRSEGENNSFYGKQHTDETKQLIIKNHKQAIRCMINGVFYQSIKEASHILKLDRDTVTRRLNSNLEKFKDWTHYTELTAIDYYETIRTNNKSNLLQ